MGIAGIGIDTVELDRFSKVAEARGDKFFEKIFTADEIEYAEYGKNKNMHLAGKFAAKEAVKKAIPNGAEIGLAWAEIEVLNGKDGKPFVRLHGKAKELYERNGLNDILVSISHSNTIAVSNAVAVKNVT